MKKPSQKEFEALCRVMISYEKEIEIIWNENENPAVFFDKSLNLAMNLFAQSLANLFNMMHFFDDNEKAHELRPKMIASIKKEMDLRLSDFNDSSKFKKQTSIQ